MNIYEPGLGITIVQATKDAIEEFKKSGTFTDGKIKFNDLLVPFSIKSDPTDIAIIYSLMHKNRQLAK